MLHVACCLWDANERSQDFSRCYNETWVEKLYRGFKRNLSRPFRFVVFTDRLRSFDEEIDQVNLVTKSAHYGCLTEPFRLNAPMIVCGLDTIVVGNVDHFADYCMSGQQIACPRDPYQPERSINGVVLSPAGKRGVFDRWAGENDMDWMRKQSTVFIDDLWPGQVVSLKAHKVRDVGLKDARIVYFHGVPKPHQLGHLPWVREHWQ